MKYNLTWFASISQANKTLHTIQHNTRTISYEIQRKKSTKHTYIRVNANKVLITTNNKTSLQYIQELVQQKVSWISKKLDMFQAMPLKQDIANNSKLYYMGNSYYIDMQTDDTIKNINVNFANLKFHIATPPKWEPKELSKAINNFYKQKAIEKIIPLTQKYSKIMQVKPQLISFKYYKRRWASCNINGNLSFNYHLMKLSYPLIEYVVIHELAHLVHHNHSKDFWELVYKYLRDYKVRQNKIREFEKLI